MCTVCLLISTLTLFNPSGLDLSPNPARDISLAQDSQIALTQVMQNLPNTSETQVLREGLTTIRTQLATVETDQEAKAILDRELTVLSQRLMASPNADRVAEILKGMMIEDTGSDNNPQAKTLPIDLSVFLKLHNQSWGWLH
ncbi:hypothetical protein BST81_24160 [Leptolyngbya sp. 'hensonii']|uniref:hypothetical protein n=1 Tax=Leptolyngbya sp. 'hensonii' TaxID=1922337 RepID=UPI00094F6A2D|nr:hypothetical protein [Leptolyngbya sp. 'hensonii']OLP15820.1 hypothetical protein BST81_24160 [Leptolyngbya sp. 'hensonii']